MVMTAQGAHATGRGRAGFWRKVGIATVGSLAVGLLVLSITASPSTSTESDAETPLVHTIQRGPFESFVTETGDVASSTNLEIRCEVKSGSGGSRTTILEIIDEGTVVKKGDFLVQFDDAALQLNLTEQQIVVATNTAGEIESRSDLDKAVAALKEYLNGTFPVEKETSEGELLQATSTQKAARDLLAHTQRMFRKGFVTRLQFLGEQETLAMADKAVQVARIKLTVLKTFTRDKMIKEYKADIEKQTAYLVAAKHRLKLSQQRRDELLKDIVACRCLAPTSGQVVYANDYSREPRIVIEEGSQIRQGQLVIRLPDPSRMQIDTKISDSKINLVKMDNPVEIVLDVDPDRKIRGTLEKIEPFPYPRRWHGAPIEYGAVIRVLDPPESLRTGQRAKVHIFVAKRKDVLQTPIQSVVERGGKHYCLVKDAAGGWSIQQVALGPNNDSFVVVKEGLDEGQVVAINPDLLWRTIEEELPDGKKKSPASLSTGVAAKSP